jgi:hypothetical protein
VSTEESDRLNAELAHRGVELIAPQPEDPETPEKSEREKCQR